MITQIARVPIERPQRYAKQLASHMGNKVPAEVIDGGWKLTFDIGTATLESNGSNLIMTTIANSQSDIEKIQFALVKHLIKFASKVGQLEIIWR